MAPHIVFGSCWHAASFRLNVYVQVSNPNIQSNKSPESFSPVLTLGLAWSLDCEFRFQPGLAQTQCVVSTLNGLFRFDIGEPGPTKCSALTQISNPCHKPKVCAMPTTSSDPKNHKILRHCHSHGSNRQPEGGCQLSNAVWVCAHCWKRGLFRQNAAAKS